MYSREGLTRDSLYCAIVVFGQPDMFILRKAKLSFAFLVTPSTGCFHDRLSESATPKYFPDLATLKVCLWII